MMKQRTSKFYVLTADVLCADSMQEINIVQRTVRAINARNKLIGDPKRFRVSLKGRLGRNNPNAIKYRSRVGVPSIWRASPYQTIRLCDAARIDVYVHAR